MNLKLRLFCNLADKITDFIGKHLVITDVMENDHGETDLIVREANMICPSCNEELKFVDMDGAMSCRNCFHTIYKIRRDAKEGKGQAI